MSAFKTLAVIGALAVVGCSGKNESTTPGGGTGGTGDGSGTAAGTGDTGDTGKAGPTEDPNAVYGPLEKGADYKGWAKLNKAPVKSKTHGGRWVNTYVNEVGVEAYKDDDADIPVGTVIVKESWEPNADDTGPSEVAGPLFVMARVDSGGEPGWWYGFHWEAVPEKWQKGLKAKQAYWRTPSKKVDYCSECHDNYPRELGSVPKDFRAY